MILTLIVAYLVGSVLFFGSLALVAGRPIPPITQGELLSDASLNQCQLDMAQVDLGYAAPAPKLETVAS
jgi:hypothetical protein